MALQTPTPPPMTAGPSPLQVLCRRVRLSLRRDPLAAVTSPSVAICLADELLARAAVGRADTAFWCSVAIRPLAALLVSASPAGAGLGTKWVCETVSGIQEAGPDDPIWDRTHATCERCVASVQLRAALPWLRGLHPGQRSAVTLVMGDALVALQRSSLRAAIAGFDQRV